MSLTQQEFNYLLKIEKRFTDNDMIYLDTKWSREIISTQSRDIFILDYYKGTYRIEKYTYNKRYRKNIVLLRYDSFGRHTNPDNTVVEGPHLHIYREGYDDKFAVSPEEIGVDSRAFGRDRVLRVLLEYFNVKGCPQIHLAIF